MLLFICCYLRTNNFSTFSFQANTLHRFSKIISFVLIVLSSKSLITPITDRSSVLYKITGINSDWPTLASSSGYYCRGKYSNRSFQQKYPKSFCVASFSANLSQGVFLRQILLYLYRKLTGGRWAVTLSLWLIKGQTLQETG